MYVCMCVYVCVYLCVYMYVWYVWFSVNKPSVSVAIYSLSPPGTLACSHACMLARIHDASASHICRLILSRVQAHKPGAHIHAHNTQTHTCAHVMHRKRERGRQTDTPTYTKKQKIQKTTDVWIACPRWMLPARLIGRHSRGIPFGYHSQYSLINQQESGKKNRNNCLREIEMYQR